MKHVVFDCDGTILDTSGAKYKLFPGIKELLLELTQDYMLYVWTARGRASTLRFFEEMGILHLFDQLCTPDDAPGKPHVAGLFSLLGSTPKHSICVIGDSSADMVGAKNFGVMAIGAIWQRDASSQTLKEFGADFIVSHPLECSKLLLENLKGDDHVR